MGYDGAGRHISTTMPLGKVEYTRDAADRIDKRTQGKISDNTQAAVQYGFTGAGDGSDRVIDAGGTITEQQIGLPGSVKVSFRTNGTSMNGGPATTCGMYPI